ncbi:clostripain-related cysteine peptidase [Treponema sp. OttesenSCG-928-L16]|nr:clostripain-related cysteine peptidase [Treponema sp. OttesenSCG-928-L16]
MVYLCGSDLESKSGLASNDIREIWSADVSENLNIVVETGGANAWQLDFVDPDTNQRWLITDEQTILLDDAGLKNMSEGETLSDFITFASERFPADRYMLVLWDHGGGTVSGFAKDERFPGSGMMSIPELNQALNTAGVVFDMIGFDCCLMSTAETAFMVEKYADYMVASQRTEPGNGWHYTPWINALSQNTSISTLELGQIIVDSYIDECSDGYYGDELTLSVIDLTYITDLFDEMSTFFSEAREGLVTDRTFISTSKALGTSRAISDNYDLVDLAYLARSMEGSEELLSCLDDCVVYNGTTIDDHNGLCLYFPYTNLSKVKSALEVYDQIGIDETYRRFITTFANLMLGGQVYNGGGDINPFGHGVSFDPDYWTDFDWVDQQQFSEYEEFYEENTYDGSELVIYEKGDNYVLSLSDEDWELITAVEQRVFLDDGEGFIDLGADSVYEYDEDGDLLIVFDNTWVALDGQLVCFYTKEDVAEGDFWFNWGVVPVLYQDEYAEIIVRWDNTNPSGYVAGWRYSGSQKGLFELRDGMTFEFLCEYYNYDDSYDDQYLWGELTVNGPVEVSYEDVGDGDCEVYYELYDIYGNTYWTETVVYGY